MSSIDNSKLWTELGLKPTEEKKKPNDEVGQEQFLELMLAQMQNQDPLKPMENGQFLTQIAQFSSAKGISDMADSFSQLSNSLTSNQALQASSLIGRTVLAPSGTGFLEPGGGGLGGSVDLQTSAQDMNITIYDQSGSVVKTIPMGQQPSGTVYFSWDGVDDGGNQMPPGLYDVVAEAKIGDKNQAQEVMIASRVESVTMDKSGQGVTLNLSGLGSISFNNVREIM
ncbi:MAG: flagellar hook assembly protein FlgD [Gammaproteobacteria bacterium]|nr:flagellar hook assembly protein FlgD [Gammaproteobacteria bacterium]